ncbi:extracellular solute-binding protein [Paenibacillus koleovorans]|uniref:extracellular solute-binding protein n=1 Tax=Paenibacillus koleovorans TaxID=121608 RepID=UPI000FD8F91A|nr:extracellular solute-binding protein [Paenibacillus koleovorans]
MDQSNPISRKTFRRRLEYMVNHLRRDIRDGLYKPGEYLPSESELVVRFEMSNKSIRKGLEQLVAEGLIVKVDRVGSRITDPANGSLTTLTLGHHYSIERDIQLGLLLQDFQTLHPAIKVNTVLLSGISEGSNLQNGAIDVFTINNNEFMGLVDTDSTHLLEPLEKNSGLYPFANEAFEHGEEQLAQPVIFSPILLAYNRKHFIESNVPEPDGSWTWGQTIRHAAALTVPGRRYGLYFHLLADNRWPAFLLQSGMRFEPDAKGSFQLAGTRLLDCIRLCKSIISNTDVFPNYMSENSNDVNELFMQGRVSMIMTNYMTLNEIKHSDIRYDISPLPYLFEPRSLLLVIGVAMSRNSKKKEAARLFMEYLASPRAQSKIREHTLSLPALKEIAEQPASPSEVMNRPSRYYLFREIMFSYRLHRELNLPLHAYKYLRQILKQYWSNLITEEELCEQAKHLFGGAASDGR